MSYFGERNTGANFGGLFARTPLLHDIAAAQQFYGANMTTRAGNTVYGFNSNAGDIYLLDNKDEKAVFCIWDAAGIDTLDMSGYDNRQTINLNPGKFSSTGGLKFNVSMADAVDVNGNNRGRLASTHAYRQPRRECHRRIRRRRHHRESGEQRSRRLGGG